MLLSASYSDLLEGHFGSPFCPYVTIVHVRPRRGQTPADSDESHRGGPALFQSCRKVLLLTCRWHR